MPSSTYNSKKHEGTTPSPWLPQPIPIPEPASRCSNNELRYIRNTINSPIASLYKPSSSAKHEVARPLAYHRLLHAFPFPLSLTTVHKLLIHNKTVPGPAIQVRNIKGPSGSEAPSPQLPTALLQGVLHIPPIAVTPLLPSTSRKPYRSLALALSQDARTLATIHTHIRKQSRTKQNRTE